MKKQEPTLNIATRKGTKGYVGYFGITGKLKSTKITRKRRSEARQDAIKMLFTKAGDFFEEMSETHRQISNRTKNNSRKSHAH